MRTTENQPAPIVLLKSIQAHDCDSAQELEYHIVTHPAHVAENLYIDYKNFSLMSSTPFDREETLNFTVSVTAVDTFNQIGSIQVIVLVQDLNDNDPLIQNLPNTLKIPEDTPVGKIIYTVEAYDPDHNSKFIFKFCKDDWVEFFTLDHKKGHISVRKELKLLGKRSAYGSEPSYLEVFEETLFIFS